MRSMTFHVPLIYYVHFDGPVLFMGEPEIVDRILTRLVNEINGVLIWENQGAYRLIPATVLFNLFTNREFLRRQMEHYPRITVSPDLSEITWNQGIAISPTVVEHLLLAPCDSSDESGKSDSATEPTVENHTDEPQL